MKTNLTEEQIIEIAKECHHANMQFCQAIGDFSQVVWEKSPEWQKQSAINGVKYHLENPDSTPEDSHKSWYKQKVIDGWKYGPVKDPDKKEHPCMVCHHELPIEQQTKDWIFLSIVRVWEKK